jgi:hypothetical protein
MSTTNNNRTARPKDQDNCGLLAIGSAGGWEISIDEVLSGPDRWYAEIEGPAVTLSFEVPSPDIVEKAIQFFAESSASPPGPGTSLVLGSDPLSPITLVRDDEYSDRFFLVVGPQDSPAVRLVIAGADLAHLVAALHQVKEDLDSPN